MCTTTCFITNRVSTVFIVVLTRPLSYLYFHIVIIFNIVTVIIIYYNFLHFTNLKVYAFQKSWFCLL